MFCWISWSASRQTRLKPSPVVSTLSGTVTRRHQKARLCLPVIQRGTVVMMVTDISFDPHAGEVATGRLFSGSLKRGDGLYVMGSAKKENRLQQVGIFMGPKRVEVEEIVAGNIAAVTGLKDAMVGSTVTSLLEMTPFESLKHYSEPVMTVAVEAKNMKDLPKSKCSDRLQRKTLTLVITINEETGETPDFGYG